MDASKDTCVWCFGTSVVTRTLPCSHNFCTECIKRLRVGHQLKCPDCSTMKLARQEIPDISESLLRRHNPTKCDCCNGGKSDQSVAGCLQCNMFLCWHGLLLHTATDLTRNHSLYRVEDVKRHNLKKRLQAYQESLDKVNKKSHVVYSRIEYLKLSYAANIDVVRVYTESLKGGYKKHANYLAGRATDIYNHDVAAAQSNSEKVNYSRSGIILAEKIKRKQRQETINFVSYTMDKELDKKNADIMLEIDAMYAKEFSILLNMYSKLDKERATIQGLISKAEGTQLVLS